MSIIVAVWASASWIVTRQLWLFRNFSSQALRPYELGRFDHKRAQH